MRLSLAFLMIPTLALAQSPPGSDIFLFDLDEASWSVTAPRDITPLDTYNNQPHFLPDGSLLYTCFADSDQADIFHYDPASGETKRLTWTAEGEYSPTPMPGGRRFSVVRVEHDGRQRLWVFPLEGGPGEIILPEIEPVGYHVWPERGRVAMFVLGEPPTLVQMTQGIHEPARLLEDVGRCLKRIPGSDRFSAVHHREGEKVIVAFFADGTREDITATVSGTDNEDYTWTKRGSLLMGKGSVLFRFTPGDDAWQVVADLASMGVKTISRMDTRGDGKVLALVSVK
jgi:hypothetical protein